MSNPTNEQKEQAREIIGNVNNYAEEHTGELSISAFGPLAQRIAAALASRDAEVRKVLEKLSVVLFSHTPTPRRCWCSRDATWTHTDACLATLALYSKLQEKGEASKND